MPHEVLSSALSRGGLYDGLPVLVVDDNELNILVARKMIENWGYDVVVAGNVDEAEAQVEAHRPFMVLLDIHMLYRHHSM